jgi:hypothetical protein
MALRSRSRFSRNEIDLFDLVDGAMLRVGKQSASMETGVFLVPYDVRADLGVAVGYRCLSVPRENHVCHVASSVYFSNLRLRRLTISDRERFQRVVNQRYYAASRATSVLLRWPVRRGCNAVLPSALLLQFKG